MTKKVLNIILLGVLLLLLSFSCSPFNGVRDANSKYTPSILVDNYINLHPDTVAYKNEAKSYKWNYEQGLMLEAIYRTWQETDNEKYYDYIKKNIDYYVGDDGSIKTYAFDSFNLDNVVSGRVLLHLYEITKERKYKLAADHLIGQLKEQPQTSEGGFWHKKIYPYQMWLDGLYMAEPFYSEYSKMFGAVSNFDDIANQFILVKKHLYDPRTGLYYHGWDESKEQKWSDSKNGTSTNFWGRSIGWFSMAMVDVLDSFPKDREDRAELLMMFQNLCTVLVKYRDGDSKLWYQVLDKKDSTGNYIETSCSSMFIYSFAKGYNKGYLTENYLDMAKESFNSLSNNFIKADDKGNFYLTNVCSVGGLGGNPYRDGSFNYYISEPKRDNDFKGYGPLIFASVELNK